MRPITAPSDDISLSNLENEILKLNDNKLFLFHLSGPMSFTSAKALIRRHCSILEYDIMLLDLTEVPIIDYTFTKALDDIIINTLDTGRKVFLVGASGKVHNMLQQQNVLKHFEENTQFSQRIVALKRANEIMTDKS